MAEHPDDLAARDQLADRLRRTRRSRGISRLALADHLGVGYFAVADREQRRNWQTRFVQEWARALGYRLDLTLTGLTVPDDGDPLAAMYDAQQPATVEEEDLLDLRILVNDLARIRRAQGVTLAALGRRLGCSEGAACRRETHPDRQRIATVQQHARAIGGVLVLDLVNDALLSALDKLTTTEETRP